MDMPPSYAEIISDLTHGICNSFCERARIDGTVHSSIIDHILEYPYNVRLYLLKYFEYHNRFTNSFSKRRHSGEQHSLQVWTMIETLERLRRGYYSEDLDCSYGYELIRRVDCTCIKRIEFWNTLLSVCPDYVGMGNHQIYENWLKTLYSFLYSCGDYNRSELKTSYDGWFSFVTKGMKAQLLKCLIKHKVNHPMTNILLRFFLGKNTDKSGNEELLEWISTFKLPCLPTDDMTLMEMLSKAPVPPTHPQRQGQGQAQMPGLERMDVGIGEQGQEQDGELAWGFLYVPLPTLVPSLPAQRESVMMEGDETETENEGEPVRE